MKMKKNVGDVADTSDDGPLSLQQCCPIDLRHLKVAMCNKLNLSWGEQALGVSVGRLFQMKCSTYYLLLLLST